MKPTISFLMLSVVLMLSGCTRGVTPMPTQPPASTDTPGATPTRTPAVYKQGAEPAGVSVLQDKGATLAFYDLQGALLGTRSLTDSGGFGDRLHVTGSLNAGLDNLSVLLLAQDTQDIFVTMDGLEILRVTGNLHGYAAAPGMSVIAFGAADLTSDARQVVSQLYISGADSLPGAAPIFSETRDPGGAYEPVGIHFEKDQPVGLWYSFSPYAIGGRIYFDLTSELNYLDLATQVTTQFHIPGDRIDQPRFSPGEVWLTYTGQRSTKFYNMETQWVYHIDWLEENDLGGGNIVVANDNVQAAWKEAGGSTLGPVPDYLPVIRTGIITEGPLQMFDLAFFEQAVGHDLGDITPVAWLDGQTLLVSLMDEMGAKQLWAVEQITRTASLFAHGEFTGFLYP